MSYLTVIVLVACAVAVVTDLRWRRIPNWLTLGLGLLVIAGQAPHGPMAVLGTVAIYAAVMSLGLIAFSLGWLGGGDVKLLAAAGAAFGWPDCLVFVIYTSLGGGILAVGVALAQGRLVATLRSAFSSLPLFSSWRPAATGPRNMTMLPYGCAIALGAAAVVLADSVAPFLRLTL